MKNVYFTMSLLVFFISGALAQTTLKSYYHSFRPNDAHHFIIANNTENGDAGYNVVWDFSELKKKGELESHMLLTSEIEASDRVPEANIVLEEYGTFFFFRMNGDLMEHFGTLTKNGTLIRYHEPFVKMKYPFEYGQSRKGEISGEIISNGNTRNFEGIYSIEADGYGTLILPGDIKIDNVIRLKSIKEKRYDQSSQPVKTISYKWYCQDVRYPLLTVIQNIQNEKPKTIKTAYYANAKRIEANKQVDETNLNSFSGKTEAVVYPNPFKEEFTLDYILPGKSDVLIEIFDRTGKKVKEMQFKEQDAGSYSRTINVEGSGFINGVYVVKFQAGDSVIKKQIVKME